MEKYYAGIGSRSTPPDVMQFMTHTAQLLDAAGYTLRSGGADGADSAFAAGSNRHEIYLPWTGFNWNEDGIVCGEVPELRAIAEKHHPAWQRCGTAVRRLHTRNVAQILGYPIGERSEFVICWTPGGRGEGGTGQAIRIATAYGVPVFDLARAEDRWRLPTVEW